MIGRLPMSCRASQCPYFASQLAASAACIRQSLLFRRCRALRQGPRLKSQHAQHPPPARR
jgi:hypothetical protein